jgi:hypothetical protein
MRYQKGLLAAFAALSAAALAGCLNNADPVAEAEIVLPSETSALVAFAGDSTRPAPARVRACSVLTEHLAALDSADSSHAGLANAIAQVCAPHPKPRPSPCDSLRVKLFSADTTLPGYDSLWALYQGRCVQPPDTTRPKPDSLRPPPRDTTKPDTLRPVPPVKPDTTRPDSVRPQPSKPDSLNPVPPAKPDSGFTPPRDPVKPVPPKKPVKDTAASAG